MHYQKKERKKKEIVMLKSKFLSRVVQVDIAVFLYSMFPSKTNLVVFQLDSLKLSLVLIGQLFDLV